MNKNAFVHLGFPFTTRQTTKHNPTSQNRVFRLSTSLTRRKRGAVLHLHFGNYPGHGSGGGGGGGNGDNEDDDRGGTANEPPAYVATSFNTRRERDSYLPEWARRLSITQLLLCVTVFVFLLQLSFGERLTATFMKQNEAIANGAWYRLFTPMFLHGGFTHLLVNCLSLHYTGPVVEGWFGKKRFIALYIFSGFCGNVASFLATPHAGVGASGAIFGLIGGFAILLLRHRDLIGRQAQGALQSLAMTVAINFAIGLSPGSYIDNFAHLGGMIGGLAFAYIVGPRLRKVRSNAGTYLIDRPLYLEAASEIRLKWNQLVKRRNLDG